MLDSKRIKEIMFALGADLCGIASIDRFCILRVNRSSFTDK